MLATTCSMTVTERSRRRHLHHAPRVARRRPARRGGVAAGAEAGRVAAARRTSSANRSGSATVIVTLGCRMRCRGSMAPIGSASWRHTPCSAVVANVIPRSARESRGGPATFHQRYGPVTLTETTLAGLVVNDQRPNVTDSSVDERVAVQLSGRTPNTRDQRRRSGSTANAKDSMSDTPLSGHPFGGGNQELVAD